MTSAPRLAQELRLRASEYNEPYIPCERAVS
jgi:hypothetical protein